MLKCSFVAYINRHTHTTRACTLRLLVLLVRRPRFMLLSLFVVFSGEIMSSCLRLRSLFIFNTPHAVCVRVLNRVVSKDIFKFWLWFRCLFYKEKKNENENENLTPNQIRTCIGNTNGQPNQTITASPYGVSCHALPAIVTDDHHEFQIHIRSTDVKLAFTTVTETETMQIYSFDLWFDLGSFNCEFELKKN